MSAVNIVQSKPELNVFSRQVQCDIRFLESRLTVMRSQNTPNAQVIRTYEIMLSSRKDVLSRLQDECQKNLKAG